MYRDVDKEGEPSNESDELFAEGTADAEAEAEAESDGEWEGVPSASPISRENSCKWYPRSEPRKRAVRKSVVEDFREIYDQGEEQSRPSKRENKDMEDLEWRKKARNAGGGQDGNNVNGNTVWTASMLPGLARNGGGIRSDRAGIGDRLSRVTGRQYPWEDPYAAQDSEEDKEIGATRHDDNFINDRRVERHSDDEGGYVAASPNYAAEGRPMFQKVTRYEDFRQYADKRPPLCRMAVDIWPFPEPCVDPWSPWGTAVVGEQTPTKLDLAWSSSVSDPSEDEAFLRLTLSPPGQHSFNEERPTPPASAYSQQVASSAESEPEKSRPRHRQTSVDRPSAKLKEELIRPPYAWATDRRAVVHPLDRITWLGIMNIHGEVLCKRCDGSQTMDINLQASFLQLDKYFMSNKDSMHDRAPRIWSVPRLLDCTMCHQSDCLKPVINSRKRHINWLFLMLTRTLGLCTLEQLKYFCKHTHKHRTGAKDRVLYLTYVGLLKQLNPAGHYD